MKLVGRPIGNYVERIVKDKNGRLVRATFCVYENDGHIKARLISAVYISESLPKTKETPFLAEFIKKESHSFVRHIGNVVSPYFSLNTLYSFGSKPRAPALI